MLEDVLVTQIGLSQFKLPVPGCTGVMLTEQGLQCQVSLDALAGLYRVLVWHPDEGFASVMPLVTIVPIVTKISPSSGMPALTYHVLEWLH